MKTIIALLSALLLFAHCSKKDIKLPVQESMDLHATSFLETPEINSLSLGVYKNGEVFISHYGELEPGKGNTPTDQTIYQIASTTKTFTGTLIAQAVVDGKITVEDDIQDYLKEAFPNLEKANRKIKVKDLLTHTSGLPRSMPDDSAIFKSTNFDSLPYLLDGFTDNYTKEDFFKDLHAVTLSTTPGEKISYSNAGPYLLAHILEMVYNKTYEELLKEFIYDKAGMSNTKLSLDENDHKHCAVGFNDRGWKMPWLEDAVWKSAGGLKSTMPDLMKYMQFQFDESNPAVKKSHEIIEHKAGKKQEKGFLWNVRYDADEGTYYSIHGGGAASQNYFMVFPEHHTGIVVMTNNSSQATPKRMLVLLNNILTNIR